MIILLKLVFYLLSTLNELTDLDAVNSELQKIYFI